MDFIERFFGVSPDGGNGILEAIYFATAAAATVLILRGRILRFVLRLRCHDNAE